MNWWSYVNESLRRFEWIAVVFSEMAIKQPGAQETQQGKHGSLDICLTLRNSSYFTGSCVDVQAFLRNTVEYCTCIHSSLLNTWQWHMFAQENLYLQLPSKFIAVDFQPGNFVHEQHWSQLRRELKCLTHSNPSKNSKCSDNSHSSKIVCYVP